jgi:competence protein ComEA
MKIRRAVVTTLAFALAAFLSSGLAVAAGKPAPTGKVNINTASVEQLTALPGVGPALASRIVEHRQKAGSFKTPAELMNVKGIGEKNYNKIQGYLTVGDGAARPAAAR